MKKIKIFLILTFVALLTACKTKEASCDAYTDLNKYENEIS